MCPYPGQRGCPWPQLLGALTQGCLLLRARFHLPTSFLHRAVGPPGESHSLQCPIPKGLIPEMKEKRPDQELSFHPCGYSQGLPFLLWKLCVHSLSSGWEAGELDSMLARWSALHPLAFSCTVQSGNGSNHLLLGFWVIRARTGLHSAQGWEDACIVPGVGQWMRALMWFLMPFTKTKMTLDFFPPPQCFEAPGWSNAWILIGFLSFFFINA